MAEKISEAECNRRNWNWDSDKKKCTEPSIGLIKMTVNRGPGCDGGVRVETIIKRLPKETRRIMLKKAEREDE